MTIGEHLEELRRRLFIGLMGFGVACGICFIFGRHVLSIFCWPLVRKLHEHHLSANTYTFEVSEGFMTYVQISLISALAISGPWLIYQLWKFVAAGLYAKERKYVTRYVPLSIGLLISGMVFLYFCVLPMVLEFFLSFTLSIPSVYGDTPTDPLPVNQWTIPIVKGDPTSPLPGQVWIDELTNQVKIYTKNGVNTLALGSENLAVPLITISDYISLVLRLLLIFGLAFQLPLVVMALVKVGIVDLPTLRTYRRHIYFVITVLAAVITPGDVVTAMVALLIPMIVLYELGLILAAWSARHSETESEEPPSE